MRRVSYLAMLACGLWLVSAPLAMADKPEKPEASQPGMHVDVKAGGAHVEAGTTPNAMEQSGATVARVRDLIGLAVYNGSDEKLGKIEDLVIDPSSGKIRYGVLSFGGFLGMGEKLFAVPWDNLKLAQKATRMTSAGTAKENHYVLDVSKEALKAAPGFDKNHWPNFADPNWAIDIDKYYRTQQAQKAPGYRSK